MRGAYDRRGTTGAHVGRARLNRLRPRGSVRLDLVELAHERVRIIRRGRHVLRLELGLRRRSSVLLLGRAYAADWVLLAVRYVGALILIFEHGVGRAGAAGSVVLAGASAEVVLGPKLSFNGTLVHGLFPLDFTL